jgi:hypothetical protein
MFAITDVERDDGSSCLPFASKSLSELAFTLHFLLKNLCMLFLRAYSSVVGIFSSARCLPWHVRTRFLIQTEAQYLNRHTSIHH